MHSYSDNKVLACKAELIKEIIRDIENCPSFLPWCNSATILSKKAHILTKLDITFKVFSESYTWKVFCHTMGKMIK
ncbi:unnamed protein product [Choristocarpus tenellus]